VAITDTSIRTIDELFGRIESVDAHVVVMGQGYVGLSLACAAADRGFTVVGVDIDQGRVERLRSGQLEVAGVTEATFNAGLNSGRLQFSAAPDAVADADVIVVCVPTPVRDHAPDLSFVKQACSTIAGHMTAGTLVILESTTYPGTTEEIVGPLLEESGLLSTRDFLLAYAPERIDPGNDQFQFARIPRLVGGTSSQAGLVASLFYSRFVDEVATLSSPRAAELAKLLENTFRHVNIALVNEMAMLCRETGLDVWEVIGAAATKPFGFMAFHPGPGVGGHCIPLDPTYLTWQLKRDVGHQFRILEQAQDINAQMPGYVGACIADALNDTGRALKGTRVLILGVAYKPDVADARESPSLKIMNWLARRGAQVSWHDPYFDQLDVNGGVATRTEPTSDCLTDAGIVVLLTPHSSYDLGWIASHAALVFDARNAYGSDRPANVVPL
jgi:UDP-N-acetyl-D-glucosamine dehydrogenase